MSKYISNDNEYYTPKEFVASFGHFDYDPATTKEKADEFEIENFDTIETDGLTSDWRKYKRIWINPPFTRKIEFLNKAIETFNEVHNDIFILLPVEFLTTKKFNDAMIHNGGILFLPNGRIKFESGLGKKASSPMFGTIVLKIGDAHSFYIYRILI